MMFSAVVFVVLLITMTIIGCLGFIMFRVGLLSIPEIPGGGIVLLALALASIIVGTVVGAFIIHTPLKPVNILINGMNHLADGDFTTRIDLGNTAIGVKLTTSFNTLAEELQNTEMLRSDFVNNFSHEFKTPIVSIRGFAKLLQKGTLAEEQKNEYIDIIAEESTRLSDLATSVLNLTKVENQSILTDITHFNLSEQIRNCILLLEKRWTQKRLCVNASFDEYFINANEELLKQVWINLLDNAIKFSYELGELSIHITEAIDSITVSVINNGFEISEENRRRIFGKFWQGDESRATEGTGIGLSIVRRITELHKGKISVESSPDETVFSVKLPI